MKTHVLQSDKVPLEFVQVVNLLQMVGVPGKAGCFLRQSFFFGRNGVKFLQKRVLERSECVCKAETTRPERSSQKNVTQYPVSGQTPLKGGFQWCWVQASLKKNT